MHEVRQKGRLKSQHRDRRCSKRRDALLKEDTEVVQKNILRRRRLLIGGIRDIVEGMMTIYPHLQTQNHHITAIVNRIVRPKNRLLKVPQKESRLPEVWQKVPKRVPQKDQQQEVRQKELPKRVLQKEAQRRKIIAVWGKNGAKIIPFQCQL